MIGLKTVLIVISRYRSRIGCRAFFTPPPLFFFPFFPYVYNAGERIFRDALEFFFDSPIIRDTLERRERRLKEKVLTAV